MIPDDGIRRVPLDNGPEQICQALIDSANNAGGRDNTTVVVATIGGAVLFRAGGANPAGLDTLEIKPTQSLLVRVWRLIFRRK